MAFLGFGICVWNAVLDDPLFSKKFAEGSTMVTDAEGRECVILPALVNSYGVWERLDNSAGGTRTWEYSLPLLEIFMVMISGLWQFFYFILKPLGLPKFTSQMIAGIFLSMAVFDDRNSTKDLFYPEDYRRNVVGTMGAFGYMMFWFLMGVKMDLGMIIKTGKKAMVIGFASVLAPTLLGMLFFWTRVEERLPKDSSHSLGEHLTSQDMVVIAIQSLSTFPVIIILLVDLKIQNSELGRLALSAAMVSDMVSVVFTVVFSVGRVTLKSIKTAGFDALAVLAFIIWAAALRPAMYWVIRHTPEGKPVKRIYIYGILVLTFASAAYWALLGQFIAFGPFILGLAIPHGPPLGAALTQKFDSFVSGILLPFFVATCVMKVDMREGLEVDDSPIIFVTFVLKFVAILLPALMFQVPFTDACALAVVLSHKGIVELGSYTFALEENAISRRTFGTVTCYILVNSFIVPMLVKVLYDPSRKYAGYQKRDIIHLKPNSELRILACIHKPDNITPMINLLETSCPRRESPIAVYVLHLVELIGQASPVFISHQMQTRKVGSHSYSDNVIISFNRFQRELWGSVTVNTFTSVSAPKQMHDDICMLALDNLTSMVLLPFHRRWSIDGSTVVSDDNMMRDLNCTVLEKAPCSVGILVDRRFGHRTLRESSDTSYQVCMIFLGGKDDREALSLAKRMTKDPRISLSVVRFVSEDDNGVRDWNKMLDSTELMDVKQNTVGEDYVIYIEELATDGRETALALRTMVHEYDMFIVGRGRGRETPLTMGLEEWSEFPELGTIGDLLASPDLDSKASVLVVQHQKHMN